MADPKEKLVGILRVDTSRIDADVNEANRKLMYIGRDSQISSHIRETISKAILQGVQDGIKNANALGLKINVGVGGSSGGGSGGGGSGGSGSSPGMKLSSVLGNATQTSIMTKFNKEGEELYSVLQAITKEGTQLNIVLNEMGEVSSHSIKKVADNVTDAKQALTQMKTTVSDMKAAYQEWTNLVKNPDSSQNAIDAARQKAEDLTARFRQLSQDAQVFVDMGLQVSGFNSQIEAGNKVLDTFSGKLASAANTSALQTLLAAYEDQARAINAVADAQAKVITSSGQQKTEAEAVLQTRQSELEKAEAVVNAILKQNSALETSKANMQGLEAITKANAEAAEKEAAARAKVSDQSKAQNQKDYNAALNQEKQILGTIQGIEKNLITAKGSEKTQLTEALNLERQRLNEVLNKQGVLAQVLGLSDEEIAKLRVAAGLDTQRVQNEAELLRLKQQQSLLGRVGSAIANIPTTMVNTLVFGATMAIARAPIQAIKQFWNNAWSYATEYYDRLNEIQIVTGKTTEQAQKLGENFRKMASDLSVSSKEIADAATIFYRQGLDDNAVNERLTATIQYAKTAGVEAENAANQITAVVNSIEKDGRGIEMTAQRVSDVFLYLGRRNCPIAA